MTSYPTVGTSAQSLFVSGPAILCLMRGGQTGKDPAWPEPVATVFAVSVEFSMFVEGFDLLTGEGKGEVGRSSVVPVPFSDFFRAITRTMFQGVAGGFSDLVGTDREVECVALPVQTVGGLRVDCFQVGLARVFLRVVRRLVRYDPFSGDNVVGLVSYVQVNNYRNGRVRLSCVIGMDGVATMFAVAIGRKALIYRRFLRGWKSGDDVDAG